MPLIWSIVLLTGLALLLVYRNIERGGDGNYFVLPIALAILVGGYAALKRLPAGMPTRLLLATLPLFVVVPGRVQLHQRGLGDRARAVRFRSRRNVRDLRADNARIFQRGRHRRHRRISSCRARHRARRRLCRRRAGVPARRDVRDAEFLRILADRAARQRRCVHRISRRAPHRLSHHAEGRAANVLNGRSRRRFGRSGALRAMPEVRVVEDHNYELYDLAALHAADARRALSAHVARARRLLAHAAKPLRDSAARCGGARSSRDRPAARRRARTAASRRTGHRRARAARAAARRRRSRAMRSEHRPAASRFERGQMTSAQRMRVPKAKSKTAR